MKRKYDSYPIDSKGKRLYLKDARITGKYESFLTYGGTVIKLSKNSSAFFDINMIEDGYFTFKIRYGDLIENCPPRLQCLIDNRVIGTTYFSRNHLPSGKTSSFVESVGIEVLGTQLISKGHHKLEIRAMFESTECVDYVEISPVHRKVEEPIFSFMVISDTHIHEMKPHPPDMVKEFYDENKHVTWEIPLYGRDGKWQYPLNWINRMLYYKMPEIMEDVVGEINKLKPDFVIHTGDLSAETDEYFITAKLLLDNLDCPYYLVQGNHDVADIYNRTMEGKLYYSFEYNGFHFIVLDSGFEKMEKGRLKWLKDELNRYQNGKIFIFTHAPFVQHGEHPNRYDVRCKNSEEILRFLEQYGNIKAIFAGHGHINETISRNGIYHFQTSALCEYPMLYRHIVVFPSVIEVRSHQVAKRYLKESFLTTSDNILNDSNNGWVIGRNSDLYSEIENV